MLDFMKVSLNKERLYYTIADVAVILDLKPSIIRFWEKEFLILKLSQRERNSKRKYKLNDIQNIFKIKELLYNEKYTIRGAVERLKGWKASYSFEEFCDLVEKKSQVRFCKDEESLFDSDLVTSLKHSSLPQEKCKSKSDSVQLTIQLTRARIKIIEIRKLLRSLK